MLLAFRVGNTRYWLFSDHLGSTAITANSSGTSIGELRYKAWGETRFSSGTTYTKRRFTGQYQESLGGLEGLYFYNSRWYDSYLNRWTSPDTDVPESQGVQAWDRYAFVNNNPVRYTDPTGHWIESAIDIISIGYDVYDISSNGLNWENGLSLVADVASLALPVVAGGGVLVRAAMHADDAVDAVRVVNTASNIAQAANQVDNAVDATRAACVTSVDLYAFGNTTGPRPPRPGMDVFPNNFGYIGPEAPPLPHGASTFGDPNMAPLSGPYHRLPAGTELPSGISVVADGVDVIPSSTNPPTHYTMYPTISMPYDDFSKAFTSLPWYYAGKK